VSSTIAVIGATAMNFDGGDGPKTVEAAARLACAALS
jgi:hypothetical protein